MPDCHVQAAGPLPHLEGQAEGWPQVRVYWDPLQPTAGTADISYAATHYISYSCRPWELLTLPTTGLIPLVGQVQQTSPMLLPPLEQVAMAQLLTLTLSPVWRTEPGLLVIRRKPDPSLAQSSCKYPVWGLRWWR